MIKELIKLATHLDNKGFHKEANYLDVVIKRAGNESVAGMRESAMASLADTLGINRGDLEGAFRESGLSIVPEGYVTRPMSEDEEMDHQYAWEGMATRRGIPRDMAEGYIDSQNKAEVAGIESEKIWEGIFADEGIPRD